MTLNARRYKARAFQALLAVTAVMAGAVIFASGSRADGNSIDTTSSWNGSKTIGPFGYPNTTTYGQTITAPAGNVTLSSFTFHMSLPSTLLFRGEVYAWDDTNHVATGSALYESAPMHTDATGVLQAVTFNTGGIQLTAGDKYILFATISKDYDADSSSSWGDWAYVGSDVYPGGGFFFNNDGGDPAQWTSSTWRGGANDLVFQVNFSMPDADLGIATPADITTDATGPSGVEVAYAQPTATDGDGTDSASVSCSPGSGSAFAIGTTTVTCTASDPDDSNGPVSTSFNVTVEGASQQLTDLFAAVQGVGPGSSLSSKVALAQWYLGHSDSADACTTLETFLKEVQAQSGKSIPQANASNLVADAERVEAVLAC